MKKLFSCALIVFVCGCSSLPEKSQGTKWEKQPYYTPYGQAKSNSKGAGHINEQSENRRHRNDSLESWVKYNNH